MLLNRVKASTATTGTGTITPAAAVSPYLSWSGGGAAAGQFYSYLIEDGAAWELGVGLYNGTTITRPGPGTDPHFESSTGALLNLSGTATVACVANVGSFVPWYWNPPLYSYFNDNFNTLPSHTDDPDVGLILTQTGPFNEPRVLGKTLTGGVNWTCKLRMDTGMRSDAPGASPTLYGNAGIGVYNAAKNKCFTYGQDSRYALHLARFNATTYDGYEVFQYMNTLPSWLQLFYTSSTGVGSFAYSWDGKTFMEAFSYNIKADLGGDPAGVGPVIVCGSYTPVIAQTVNAFSLV